MNHLILYVLGFLKFIIENDLHTSTRFSHTFYLLFVDGRELATGWQQKLDEFYKIINKYTTVMTKKSVNVINKSRYRYIPKDLSAKIGTATLNKLYLLLGCSV